MARVLPIERSYTGSCKVCRQFSSVQGSAILKNPKSFMNVPVNNNVVGITVMINAKLKIRTNAG